jgi:hypothetical protein
MLVGLESTKKQHVTTLTTCKLLSLFINPEKVSKVKHSSLFCPTVSEKVEICMKSDQSKKQITTVNYNCSTISFVLHGGGYTIASSVNLASAKTF